MIRQIAGRLTGAAVSTVRFAAGIPLGVARSAIEHVTHRGDDTSEHDAQGDDRAGRESAQQQAAATPAPTRDPAARAAKPGKASSKSAATPGKAAPAQGASATPGEPEVVLAVDAPPAEFEPPVDVVGEALAAENAEKAQRPPKPQPVHVNEDTEVVYSTTTSDDD